MNGPTEQGPATTEDPGRAEPEHFEEGEVEGGIPPEVHAALIRQEHRLIPAIVNLIKYRGDPGRRGAAVRALLWRLFGPGTVVITGTGIIAVTTLWVTFQQTRMLDVQNELMSRQMALELVRSESAGQEGSLASLDARSVAAKDRLVEALSPMGTPDPGDFQDFRGHIETGRERADSLGDVLRRMASREDVLVSITSSESLGAAFRDARANLLVADSARALLAGLESRLDLDEMIAIVELDPAEGTRCYRRLAQLDPAATAWARERGNEDLADLLASMQRAFEYDGVRPDIDSLAAVVAALTDETTDQEVADILDESVHRIALAECRDRVVRLQSARYGAGIREVKRLVRRVRAPIGFDVALAEAEKEQFRTEQIEMGPIGRLMEWLLLSF